MSISAAATDGPGRGSSVRRTADAPAAGASTQVAAASRVMSATGGRTSAGGLVLRRTLPALAVAVAVTEAALVTPGIVRGAYSSSASWPLLLVETAVVLTAATAAAVIAFRLLRLRVV